MALRKGTGKKSGEGMQWQGLVSLWGRATILGVLGGVIATLEAIALSDPIFTPYYAEIEQKLPASLAMRLPQVVPTIEQIKAGHSRAVQLENHPLDSYQIGVTSTYGEQGLRVDLFTCPTQENSCLVGSFTVIDAEEASAKQIFEYHQGGAAPITLEPQVVGYFLAESPEPTSSSLASVMWQQGGAFYQVQFVPQVRQDLLYMALSMATGEPLSHGVLEQAIESTTDMNREREASLSAPDELTDTYIDQIRVLGSTVLTEQEMGEVLATYEEQILTLAEMTQVADAVTQLYIDRGYLTSRASLGEQAIEDNVLTLDLVEGQIPIDKITIEWLPDSPQRLNEAYIRDRVMLGIKTPFNLAALEERLKLLERDPRLTQVISNLRPTGVPGESKLVVMVREAPSFNVNFSFDNYSPPSLGSERGGIVLGFRNWSGFGDQIAASFNRSTTGGNNQLDITYRAPLNARDGTLQARIAPNWTEITAESFDVLKIRGESELYELSYRQPLVRTTQKELGLSAGFTFQEGRTFIFNDLAVPFGIGPDQDGISRTSVIRVGIDYLRRDPLGSWALRSVQSFGTGLFNATTNEAPVPDGHFFSWQGQAQRAQQLAENHLLILRGDLQLTPHSLLPSQQFVIGGGQLVRGYRQNVRSGDNGLRFSIEDRITVKRDRQGNPILQVSPFIDLGTVWNVDGNPNVLPDRNGVMGTGIGILAPDILSGLKVDGVDLRLDYGVPLLDLGDPGDNLQDHGFYFNLNYHP